jgi:hypothetical protein
MLKTPLLGYVYLVIFELDIHVVKYTLYDMMCHVRFVFLYCFLLADFSLFCFGFFI